MKKAGLVLLLISLCTALVLSSNIYNTNKVQDEWADLVDLSREGGTTRAANRFSIQSVAPASEPVVEARMGNNVVTIMVQNYVGPVTVDIYGSKGAKQSFFESYDMGFDIISLSGLGADEYTIRITLGDIVYTGTIYKGKYGNR